MGLGGGDAGVLVTRGEDLGRGAGARVVEEEAAADECIADDDDDCAGDGPIGDGRISDTWRVFLRRPRLMTVPMSLSSVMMTVSVTPGACS